MNHHGPRWTHGWPVRLIQIAANTDEARLDAALPIATVTLVAISIVAVFAKVMGKVIAGHLCADWHTTEGPVGLAAEAAASIPSPQSGT